MAPEHFLRLGCGREDPEAALGSGELAFEGDQELGTQVVQAMDFMI
jgi:predicted lipid carrier protein YhbT